MSSKPKIKAGMKGSNGGRNRWACTQDLKKVSKGLRRIEDKKEIEKQEAN